MDYASEGGKKEKRTREAVDAAAEWHVGSTPVMTLAAAGAADLELPVDALRLPNGMLVVADEGGPSLHWYDHAGNHTLTTGQRGGGPGEFRD